jgi:galactokinase
MENHFPDQRLAEIIEHLSATRDGGSTLREEILVVSAPGRVNLIGEHVDYNEGVVLPMAIDRETLVGCAARSDDQITAYSLDLGKGSQLVSTDRDANNYSGPPWGAFLAASVRAATHLGADVHGVDIVLSSSVPIGAGLSSSAALSVALILSLCNASGVEPDARELALAAQACEIEAVGVPVGNMDQLASALGVKGHALRIDCRDLSVTPIPIPDSLAVMVVHSGISRTLESSAYAERRAACEAVAARLGYKSLRDARPEEVADNRYAKHVVAEIARVDAFIDVLRRDDLEHLGSILSDGHASLRDDFDVSLPDIDTLVELLVKHGAIGARLTGAGFGGCVVALARADEMNAIADAATKEYAQVTTRTPQSFIVHASRGAHQVQL